MKDKLIQRFIEHAQILIASNRFEAAEKKFGEALSYEPEDAELMYGLAYCQFHLSDKHQECLQTIKQTIEIEPENPHYLMLWSLAVVREGDYLQALEIANRVVELAPDDASSFHCQAQVYYAGHAYDEARQSLQHALSLEPDHHSSRKLLAECLRQAGKINEARKLSQEILQDEIDLSGLMLEGHLALEAGQIAEAQEVFREALRQDPQSEYIRAQLLKTYQAHYKPYTAVLRFIGRLQTSPMETVQIFSFLWLLAGIISIGIGIASLYALKQLEIPDVVQEAIQFRLVVFLAASLVLMALWIPFKETVSNVYLLFQSEARLFLQRQDYLQITLQISILLVCMLLGLLCFVYASAALLAPILYLLAAGYSFNHCFYNKSRVGPIIFAISGFILVGLGVYSGLQPTFEVILLCMIAGVLLLRLIQSMAGWKYTYQQMEQ